MLPNQFPQAFSVNPLIRVYSVRSNLPSSKSWHTVQPYSCRVYLDVGVDGGSVKVWGKMTFDLSLFEQMFFLQEMTNISLIPPSLVATASLICHC